MKLIVSVSIIILIIIKCLFLVNVDGKISKKEHRMRFDTNPNETEQISILVGRSGAIETLAEGDEGEEDTEGGEIPVTSTSYDGCRNSRCCYQFTWQGYLSEEDIPAPENTTCAFFKKMPGNDDSLACFDPMVYTSRVTESGGNPPNITELQNRAERENWNIYCPLTKDKACLTVKYFARSGENQVVNETRFCGSITEKNSGSQIQSGCYKEKVAGYFREVCACQDKSFCNSGISNLPSILFLSSVAFTVMLLNLMM